ncbi:MarR family transcriptional regulator [Arthrobacter sp. CC3]|uniref:MarR family winged helix-turn-helix transcriptional regulator n=1 Tax=Arthrobacter sp. CC3 TaxID=3029185 RepID=UPI003266B4C4
MIDVNEFPADASPQHIAALLAGAFDSLRAELNARTFPGLRPSHYRVMSLIPGGGLRLSELAERAAITRAGIGQFMKYLENLGYVALRPDPSDSRAKIVRLTPSGTSAVELSTAIIAETETRWEAALGAGRYGELRRSLQEIGRLAPPPAA